MSAVSQTMVGGGGKPARLDIEKFAPAFLLVGLIGVLVSWGLMFGGPKLEMAQSYLFGYIFWLSITVGCFGFTIFYHLIRGKWLLPVLRMLEAGGGVPMLLVMAVLFLPIIIPVVGGNGYLYEWANAAVRNSDLILKHKEPWLNPTGFGVRYLVYFGSWIALAWGFKASSLRQEKTGNLRELVMRNNFAGASFVFFVLSVTFSFTDWVMSLDAHWSSTMYGFWTTIASGIGGFSFVVMLVCLNAKKEWYKGLIRPNITRDMGNILFALTMLWAYTSISQYLIIWSGNLPETNFYYVERSKFGWNVIGLICILGQFFIPFVLLLTPRNKKDPMKLAKVAGFMFVIHLFDVYLFVVPAFRHTGPFTSALGFDLLALVSIGCLWLGVFGTMLKTQALLPSFDNRLEEVNAH